MQDHQFDQFVRVHHQMPRKIQPFAAAARTESLARAVDGKTFCFQFQARQKNIQLLRYISFSLKAVKTFQQDFKLSGTPRRNKQLIAGANHSR